MRTAAPKVQTSGGLCKCYVHPHPSPTRQLRHPVGRLSNSDWLPTAYEGREEVMFSFCSPFGGGIPTFLAGGVPTFRGLDRSGVPTFPGVDRGGSYLPGWRGTYLPRSGQGVPTFPCGGVATPPSR